jgi:beta-glucosidase
VKLLKGFQRITLQPGETRTVSFTIGREQLQYLDADMQMTVEPGEFVLMVGGSSETTQQISLQVVSG